MGRVGVGDGSSLQSLQVRSESMPVEPLRKGQQERAGLCRHTLDAGRARRHCLGAISTTASKWQAGGLRRGRLPRT